MSRRRSVIPLTDDERERLRRIVRTGKHAARTITRAQILLLSASGEHTVASICRTLAVCPATVYNVRARYRTDGLPVALHENPRPGFPRRITPGQKRRFPRLPAVHPPLVVPAGRSNSLPIASLKCMAPRCRTSRCGRC